MVVNVFNQYISVYDGSRINAYGFPPFSLIEPRLRFIASENATVTIAGLEIATNSVANTTKTYSLATKNSRLVANEFIAEKKVNI